MRRMLVIKLATFFLVATLTCWGQDRGTILGRVTDPSSAVIAGATLTVTNQDTGIKTTTNTNEAGNYVVRGLAFGRYEVECEATGFRKYVGKDNSVNVAQTLTLDIALQVGAVEQTVEVSGAAPLVESSTSDLGTVVDQKQVADLPLSVSGNVRNPESFVFLARSPAIMAQPRRIIYMRRGRGTRGVIDDIACLDTGTVVRLACDQRTSS